MKTIKFILFCVPLVVFKCVVAKRISEIKCDELASLDTDPQSLNPHLMEVMNIVGSENRYTLAVLVSEIFVLTSKDIYDENDIRVRKFKLPEELYSDPRPYFYVKRIFREYQAVAQNGLHQLKLIQLNETVPYLNTRSIYRPACLWTDAFQPTNLYSWEWFSLNKTMIDPYIRNILDDDCSPPQISWWPQKEINISDIDLQSHLCIASDKYKVGTPIELKHRGENFIYGILAYYSHNTFTHTRLAMKINRFIEWIEPKVWPKVWPIVWPQLQESPNQKCGQRLLKHKPLLTFAQPTYHGEYPWHVAIYRNNVYSCGGTILNRRAILTAGHCVQDDRGVIPANWLLIKAGTYNLIDYPIEARNLIVETIIVHENYSRTYLENDIAILKLSSSIKFSEYIQPICLSNTLDYNNFIEGSVAGWGVDQHNQPSNKLLQATLPIINNWECRESNRDFFPQYLNDHNYCAGYDNGTSVCSGDSGSSMVLEYDSHFYIRGIVSLAVALPNTDRCDITQLALFTDVPKLYNWIMSNVEVDDNE